MQTWAVENAGTILLFAQVALVWMLVQYAWPELARARRGATAFTVWEWARGALATLAAVSASFWLAGAEVAGLMAVGGAVVPWIRTKVRAALAAEFEIAANVGFLAVLAIAVDGRSARHVGKISDHRSAAVLLVAGMVLFSVRGGTYIVRGILDKVGTLPPLDPAAGRRDEFEIDVKEYNRGRLIGSIERVLLVTMVAVHSYEALGFLIAAKGLIRSRELENRSWAEYFLVGTLASTLVALVLGLAMQAVLKSLW